VANLGTKQGKKQGISSFPADFQKTVPKSPMIERSRYRGGAVKGGGRVMA
jgi:hypothetical protein